MRFPRSSGILLHPTSLASRYGIGDLGAEARRFVDFLATAGQKLWQVLPLGPTGFGDSPYQCFSASGRQSAAHQPGADGGTRLPGRLRAGRRAGVSGRPVDFERLVPWKTALLESAAQPGSGFEEFCEANQHWLDDFALFVALEGPASGRGVDASGSQARAIAIRRRSRNGASS